VGNAARMALALVALVSSAEVAMAHAALVEARLVPGILVEAVYDTGEPMVGAQVTVYGPTDPTQPRMTGLTDTSGRFGFVPTPADAGSWAVQVRQAGHGGMAYLRIDGHAGPAAGPVETSTSRMSMSQRLVMGFSVVWGFIGTALFFARRRSVHASS
jgi:nickel transport protein